MKPRIVFRPSAFHELREACEWYDAQQSDLGVAFLEIVAFTIDNMQAYPDAYPLVEGQIRRAVLARFPYALFYRTGKDAIEVIAVFHHKRKPSTRQDG